MQAEINLFAELPKRFPMGLMRPMNALQKIRLENLQLLVEESGGSQAKLAQRLERTKEQINSLIKGKPIGDKLAAAIAEKAGKPQGWMDVEHGSHSMREPVENSYDPRVREELPPYEVSADLTIAQYDAGGSMGHGRLMLEEGQPGIIKSWRVDREWLRLNVRHYTSEKNLCIVTGFGPSMRPRYNPGDPLLMDSGINTVESDGVYFFRVDDCGYIKQLQRIPSENGTVIRARSYNSDYEPFDITKKMDFEVFGKILTIWKSEQV